MLWSYTHTHTKMIIWMFLASCVSSKKGIILLLSCFCLWVVMRYGEMGGDTTEICFNLRLNWDTNNRLPDFYCTFLPQIYLRFKVFALQGVIFKIFNLHFFESPFNLLILTPKTFKPVNYFKYSNKYINVASKWNHANKLATI